MKQRKLLFLLTAVFALSVPLSACDGAESSSSSQQEPEKHAMATHFVLGDDRAAYSSVARYEGELVKEYDSYNNCTTINREHNLVVLRNTDYTEDNKVKTTLTVLNTVSGSTIREETVENDYVDNARLDTVSIDVNTYYPLMEITNAQWQKDSATDTWEQKTTYSYYYVKDGGSSWFASGLETRLKVKRLDSMCIFTNVEEGKEIWMGEDMEILRSFSTTQTEGYTTPSFNASYNDYLYAWDFSQTARVVEVYNREGICSMQYTYPSDVVMVGYNQSGPVVLNDGNILVQELKLAEEDSTDYDLKILQPGDYGFVDQKVYLTSKIIDYKTGAVQEVDLDYMVIEAEAAYARNEGSNFPFALQADYDNQAYISKIINQELAPIEYVVMNNDGSVAYTMQNEWLRTNPLMALMGQNPYNNIFALNEQYYVATNVSGVPSATAGGETWLFDYDGNKKAFIPNSMFGMTEDYIVTYYGIYDYTNTLVYDMESSPLVNDSMIDLEPFFTPTEIFMLGVNRDTKKMEIYQFDGKEFVKQETEEKVEFDVTSMNNLPMGNKATVTLDSMDYADIKTQDSYTWTLYNEKGEAFLKLQTRELFGSVLDTDECEDVALYETEIDGKSYLYVVQ